MNLPVNATLLVIDVQQGFNDPRWGERNNPQAEANIARLLRAWRATHRPVVHVQHTSTQPTSPLHPEQPGVAFKPEAHPQPGEPIVQKSVNSAFIGTDLEARLRAAHVGTLVIVGLTTDHCVSTTTRMAGNLGFHVHLIGDATATFAKVGPDGRTYAAQDVHDVHLASLHGEFADVTTTNAVLDALHTPVTTP